MFLFTAACKACGPMGFPALLTWRCSHCKYSCCSACLHLQGCWAGGRNQSEHQQNPRVEISRAASSPGCPNPPGSSGISACNCYQQTFCCWEQVRVAARSWLKPKEFICHLIIIGTVSGNRWGVFLLHVTTLVTETQKSQQSDQKSLSIWEFE